MIYIVIHTYDLGQNMVGWCRFNFTGQLGYGTYIRHGEVLVQPTITNKLEIWLLLFSYSIYKLINFSQSTRDIYTENLRRATASDTYILNGNPTSEIYEPT